MKPETCPKCGKPLKVVYEERSRARLEFMAGSYVEDDSQAQGEIYCWYCNSQIGGWRADGETWGFVPEMR